MRKKTKELLHKLNLSRRHFSGAQVILVAILVHGLTCPGWSSDLPLTQQYVNISGLPGGGQPLDPLGRATGEGPGAVQLNIPLAFTPSRGYAGVGGWQGSYVGRASDNFENGTALISVGAGKPGHGVYVGIMFLSRVMDYAYNIQWQVAHRTDDQAGIAIGIQDVLDTEEGARSPYIVASKVFTENRWSPAVTLGYGEGRFRNQVFVGFSAKLNKWAYLTAEYDGFQFNGGFVLQPWHSGSVYPSLTLAVNDSNRPLIGLALLRRQ